MLAKLLRLAMVALLALGCAPRATAGERVVLVFPTSGVGAEARVLERQLERFERENPGIVVERQLTPDAADQRRQLFVQWLSAGTARPDVLQLDVIWTAEFAAAGWILPLDPMSPDTSDFFPGVLGAARHRGRLWALPWFVDVGMLYYRSDLVAEPPATLDALSSQASALVQSGKVEQGLVWPAARYEGLVTVFVEYLGAYGGQILDADGNVVVDSPAAVGALEAMRSAIDSGVVPRAALGWQEEPVRFAFQNGQAAFMRNWPYAAALLASDPDSRVRGRFAVAPMPRAPGGSPTAALGGQQLAINAHSRHPKEAFALVRFLTAREQMLERARLAGQLPARRSLFSDPALDSALGVDAESVRAVVESARPRPVTPLYGELSELLQVELHRALSGQAEPRVALERAASEMRRRIAEAEQPPRAKDPRPLLALVAGALIALGAVAVRRHLRVRRPSRERRLAWALAAPALAVIALVALFPLGWTLWESLHADDLRMPWRGRPYIGFDHYRALGESSRFWHSIAKTLGFTLISVALEIALGLGLACVIDRLTRFRGALTTLALVPWALPTVVAALVWRLLFEPSGALAHPVRAWIPIVLADVWKTAPFVALLLLPAVQSIDRRLYEAARLDGAGSFQQFRFITLPLVTPAILVALVFRTLDAFRVFDLVYVLTGGGPGTATEPIAFHTFTTLLSELRFGRGSALGVVVFGVAFALSLLYVRLLSRRRELGARS